MSDIGFIGTGTIGAPIAACILAHCGHLQVFDTNPDACADLVAEGATLADDIPSLARSCRTVLMSLPGPEAIEAVVLGPNGLLENRDALETIIDLSTNRLSLARECAARAAAAGVAFLDAPVSGGKRAALDGALAIMVGGDAAVFERERPLLEAFGKHLFFMGEAGTGTLTKLVNNQIFLSASVLVQEGFVMGAKAGMDSGALLEVLKASSAAPIVERAALFLSRRFDLGVFSLDIAAKDVALAVESARESGASVPLTEAALEVYERARQAGLGDADFFATSRVLEEAAGTELPALAKGKKS